MSFYLIKVTLRLAPPKIRILRVFSLKTKCWFSFSVFVDNHDLIFVCWDLLHSLLVVSIELSADLVPWSLVMAAAVHSPLTIVKLEPAELVCLTIPPVIIPVARQSPARVDVVKVRPRQTGRLEAARYGPVQFQQGDVVAADSVGQTGSPVAVGVFDAPLDVPRLHLRPEVLDVFHPDADGALRPGFISDFRYFFISDLYINLK